MEDPDLEDPDPAPAQQLSPVPFAVALLVVVIAGAFAYFSLREDPGELVRPDRLTAIGDDEVRAEVHDRGACDRILRAQVDLADEVVFVELVVERSEEDCSVRAFTSGIDITLPEPIGDRELRAGVGRYQIPCSHERPTVTCTPDR